MKTKKPYKLVIANMYRAKNKNSFFAIHQAITRLSEFDIEFHIIWDDVKYSDEWTDKINSLDCKIVSYSKEDLDNYCKELGISESFIESFKNFKAVYFIVHGHYLRSKGINYYLIYDDDIVLKEDIEEFKDCLSKQIPCLISEPMNAGCDKVLLQKLIDLYGGQNALDYYRNINPRFLGFNAGIQGISTDMYEDFMDKDYFNYLLRLFDYNGIYDSSGKEITGPQRTAIDTQQQSFFGVMNILRSKTPPTILDPEKYFVCPNWGFHPTYGEIDSQNEFNGWDINMKSKIVHFIGHTVFEGKYYGKPKVYENLVNEYLKNHDLL